MAREITSLEEYIKEVMLGGKAPFYFSKAPMVPGTWERPGSLPDPVPLDSERLPRLSRSRPTSGRNRNHEESLPREKAIPCMELDEDIMLPDRGNGPVWLRAGDLVALDDIHSPKIIFGEDYGWGYAAPDGRHTSDRVLAGDTFTAVTGKSWSENSARLREESQKQAPFRGASIYSWDFSSFGKKVEAALGAGGDQGKKQIQEICQYSLAWLDAFQQHEVVQWVPEIVDAARTMEVAVRDFMANGADRNALELLRRNNVMQIRLDTNRSGAEISEIEATRKYLQMQNFALCFKDAGLEDLQALCNTFLIGESHRYKHKADTLRRELTGQTVEVDISPVPGKTYHDGNRRSPMTAHANKEEEMQTVFATSEGTLMMSPTTAKNLLNALQGASRATPGSVQYMRYPEDIAGDGFKVAYFDKNGVREFGGFTIWNDGALSKSCIMLERPEGPLEISLGELERVVRPGEPRSHSINKDVPRAWWKEVFRLPAKLVEKVTFPDVAWNLSLDKLRNKLSSMFMKNMEDPSLKQIGSSIDAKFVDLPSAPPPALDMESANAAYFSVAAKRKLTEEVIADLQSAGAADGHQGAHVRLRQAGEALKATADMLKGIPNLADSVYARCGYLHDLAETSWGIGTFREMDDSDAVRRFIDRKIDHISCAREKAGGLSEHLRALIDNPREGSVIVHGLETDDLENKARDCREAIEFLYSEYANSEERGADWFKETILDIFAVETALRQALAEEESEPSVPCAR